MDNNETNWDTGSHEGFYAYYEQQSLSPATFERFKATLRYLAAPESPSTRHRLH